jgi:hypothetical protein
MSYLVRRFVLLGHGYLRVKYIHVAAETLNIYRCDRWLTFFAGISITIDRTRLWLAPFDFSRRIRPWTTVGILKIQKHVLFSRPIRCPPCGVCPRSRVPIHPRDPGLMGPYIHPGPGTRESQVLQNTYRTLGCGFKCYKKTKKSV